MIDLAALCWPVSRLDEAVGLIARRSGLPGRPREAGAPGSAAVKERLAAWVEALAAGAGLEAEPVVASYAEAETLLRGRGPALVYLPDGGEPAFLVVLGAAASGVALLGADLRARRVPVSDLRGLLCARLESPHEAAVQRLLDESGVDPRRRARARAGLLRQRLAAASLEGVWLLRLPPGAGLWSQCSEARLPGRVVAMVAAHVVQYGLWLLSWWMLGRAALQGRLDRGWLAGWLLLLLTLVPLQVTLTWLQGRVTLGAGAIVKRRLLAGALGLQPEQIRHQGAGELLGRVLESEAAESLALSGGVLGLLAAVELLVSMGVLAAGAAGWPHAVLLGIVVALAMLLGGRYLRKRRRWTAQRLAITHELVERMVGQRTRLAQEKRDRWHDGEDQALEAYLTAAAALDRDSALVQGLVPRGWLVVGLAALVPSFAAGGSPAALAVSLGGVILAQRALRRLSVGLSHLAGAVIAWAAVAPLYEAAARVPSPGAPIDGAGGSAPGADGRPLLEAHDLVFRYPSRGDPVLRGCSLSVRSGERLLLEGRSGAGKSTLASVLAGLRPAQSGLLLLDGLDWHSLGEGRWRQRVAAAPQFHENHVLTGTLAFNLLMGRRWPGTAQDWLEAETVCRGLGLGELLERMPAGMLQVVGDSGWQLSHGERSRVYIARALLQRPELMVLDESFAALDPENLKLALGYVLEHAGTVMVIAHP